MKSKVYLFIFLIYTTLSLGSSQSKLDSLLFEGGKQESVNSINKLRLVQAVKISTIDPIQVKDQYSGRIVDKIYNTLFIYDKDGEIKANLVENWKWTNDRTLIINLKKNIYFHNGENMTAEDVKSSFERVISKGVFKDLFDDVENIKVISKYQVEFKLKGKNSLFLSMLTYQMSSIVKEKDGRLIGTGPYILKTLTNKEIVLIKNKKYFKGSKGPNEVSVIFEGSERRRVISFFNESVDGIADITEKNILKAKEEGLISEESKIIQGNDVNTISLLFGGKDKVFTSRKSREAVLNGLDRKELIEKTLGGEEAKTFFPENFFKGNLSKIKNTYNETLSKKEIKELGLEKKEIELSILNDSTSMELAKKIKNQLKNVGINIVIVPYQQEAYSMKVEKNDFELALYGIVTNKNYPIYNLGRVMLYDIKNPDMYNAVKPFIDIMKTEKERENREKIYDKIVYLMSKDVPYIPLVHKNTLYIGNEKINNTISGD